MEEAVSLRGKRISSRRLFECSDLCPNFIFERDQVADGQSHIVELEAHVH